MLLLIRELFWRRNGIQFGVYSVDQGTRIDQPILMRGETFFVKHLTNTHGIFTFFEMSIFRSIFIL